MKGTNRYFHSFLGTSLRHHYPIAIRVAFLFSILTLAVLMGLLPRFDVESTLRAEPSIRIEQFDIPRTVQFELPPPPLRPAIPIESESLDMAEDVTIPPTGDIGITTPWPPEPPPPPPHVIFKWWDKDPIPIGGYKALMRRVIYPEIAREAGVEGLVEVEAFVNKKGIVTECKVVKGVPNTGLDEAAVKAVKETKFHPAQQRERDVGVWVRIPIHFRLNG